MLQYHKGRNLVTKEKRLRDISRRETPRELILTTSFQFLIICCFKGLGKIAGLEREGKVTVRTLVEGFGAPYVHTGEMYWVVACHHIIKRQCFL